jgi:hypothetical protein
VVIGQGAKPGGGGMLLGQKISERVAEMRTLPEGIDQRSACRHPDWTGPDDLEIKIEELREITDWEKPIYVKVGASRPTTTRAGGQSRRRRVVLDGMQGGTAATQEVFIEHVGIPTLAAIRRRCRRCRTSACTARCSSSSRAASAAAPTSPRSGARRRRGLDRHRGAGRIGDNDPRYEERISQARHHRRRL